MASDKRALDKQGLSVGIFLGLLFGALYAITHLDKSGALRRKDLATFGGGTIELEIDTSITDAKDAAKRRLDDGD